jgi:hypothetical protein
MRRCIGPGGQIQADFIIRLGDLSRGRGICRARVLMDDGGTHSYSWERRLSRGSFGPDFLHVFHLYWPDSAPFFKGSTSFEWKLWRIHLVYTAYTGSDTRRSTVKTRWGPGGGCTHHDAAWRAWQRSGGSYRRSLLMALKPSVQWGSIRLRPPSPYRVHWTTVPRTEDEKLIGNILIGYS